MGSRARWCAALERSFSTGGVDTLGLARLVREAPTAQNVGYFLLKNRGLEIGHISGEARRLYGESDPHGRTHLTNALIDFMMRNLLWRKSVLPIPVQQLITFMGTRPDPILKTHTARIHLTQFNYRTAREILRSIDKPNEALPPHVLAVYHGCLIAACGSCSEGIGVFQRYVGGFNDSAYSLEYLSGRFWLDWGVASVCKRYADAHLAGYLQSHGHVKMANPHIKALLIEACGAARDVLSMRKMYFSSFSRLPRPAVVVLKCCVSHPSDASLRLAGDVVTALGGDRIPQAAFPYLAKLYRMRGWREKAREYQSQAPEAAPCLFLIDHKEEEAIRKKAAINPSPSVYVQPLDRLTGVVV